MAEMQAGALIETKAMEKGFTKQSVLTYMDELNTQISNLKRQVRDLEDAPAQIKETVKTVVDESKVKQLQAQVDAEHKARVDEKKSYETDKVGLNQKIAELTKNLTTYAGELEKCKKLLSEAHQKVTSTDGKGAAHESQIAELEIELQSKKDAIDNLTKNLDDAESKLASANIKLSESEKAKNELEKKLGEKDKEVSEWKTRAETAAPVDVANIDISNVSPIVQQILDGAQTAAETTKREAAKEAEKIHAEADKYSKDARAEADQYSKKCRGDADAYALAKQGEADSYSEKTRSDSDVYCKQVTSDADKEAKRTTEDADAKAKKIIADASAEARKAKDLAEKESIEISASARDIKELLTGQIGDVTAMLDRVSETLITVTTDAQKAITKSKAASKAELEKINGAKTNELLSAMKNGVPASGAASGGSKRFDPKELQELAEAAAN